MTTSIVVGGTRGIGRSIAAAMLRRGDQVLVLARSRPEPTHSLPGARYWPVDINDGARLASVVQKVAAAGPPANLVVSHRFRGSGDSWASELDVGLTATKQLIEEVVPHLDVGSCPSVVLIASVAADFIADQELGYHVVKAATVQLARYYAVKLGPRGIRVNSVSPGTVLKEESRAHYVNEPELYGLYCSITPLRRMGTADEVAGVVTFLCSEAASFVTGQNIVVDGGVSLQWQESLARRVSLRPAVAPPASP